MVLFKIYDQPVSATIQLLDQLNIKVTNTAVNKTILSHPDYPSLLSISDSLASWNIENAAVKTDKENLNQYPFPLMAFMGREFKVITSADNGTITYIDENNRSKKQSKDAFLKNWAGIALLVQPGEQAGEKEYITSKKKENQQQRVIPLFLAITGLTILAVVYSFAQFNSLSSIVGLTLLLLLKLGGSFITTLLLWYEIDKKNPVLQKICTGGNPKTNCNAILSSPQAKLFNTVSWSEIGFFYFAGSFLIILLFPQLLPGIAWLNILALPYTVFSFYYQKVVAKQWCRLCVAVQVILLSEFAVSFITGQLTYPSLSSFSSLYPLFMTFSLPVGIWYLIKPLLLKEQQTKNTPYELARLKHNPQIFYALLYKQKQIVQSIDGLGILIGIPAAKNTIVKVCNPYCGPCARAHKVIDELLEHANNLKVQIIFTATNNENDITAAPAKHLMAIAQCNDQEIIKKALDDWYLADKKDYDTFAAKYPLSQSGESILKSVISGQITKQEAWCRAQEISFTPTIFFNGYQLPELYTVGDLKYFLAE